MFRDNYYIRPDEPTGNGTNAPIVNSSTNRTAIDELYRVMKEKPVEAKKPVVQEVAVYGEGSHLFF